MAEIKVEKPSKAKYTIRVITAPYVRYEHTFGKVYSIPCNYNRDVVGSCDICYDYSSSMPYWHVGVIDRDINEVIILKLNFKYFYQFRQLATDPNWGEPKHYDIDLYTNPIMSCALPKSPLSESDRLLASKIDKDYLVKLTTPPSSDEINILYKKFKEKLAVLL